MTDLIYYYPVDYSGRNPTNYIDREPHLLVDHVGVDVRVIKMNHGGFYTRDLKVLDSTYQELRPYQDYVATYTYEDLSVRTGLEVCGAIVITNPNVKGTVYVTAQMVGGDVAISPDAVQVVIQHLIDHPEDPVDWAGIVGETRKYGPGELKDELWDHAPFTELNRELSYLASVLSSGDQESLMIYRGLAKQRSQDFVTRFGTEVVDHESLHNNPHRVTKEQIGLKDVLNYPKASEAQAAGGTHNASYMTVLRTHQAIHAQALSPLRSHVADRNNPHGLDADDINAPFREDIDALLPEFYDETDEVAAAQSLETDQGRMTYSQLVTAARKDIPTAHLTSGTLESRRLGTGNPSANTVLTGDGRWTTIQTLVDRYAPADGGQVIYIGNWDHLNVHTQGIPAHEVVLSYVNQTYVGANDLPVGTVLLYHLTETWPFWRNQHGHGSYETFRYINALFRTPLGWGNFHTPAAFGIYIPPIFDIGIITL